VAINLIGQGTNESGVKEKEKFFALTEKVVKNRYSDCGMRHDRGG
jgi:hypothetical protein